MNTGKLRFQPVGWADGQSGAGGGPMIWAQHPVRGFCPLCFQSGVLKNRSLEVERLTVECPPVESEAFAYRILLWGSGEGAGFYG